MRRFWLVLFVLLQVVVVWQIYSSVKGVDFQGVSWPLVFNQSGGISVNLSDVRYREDYCVSFPGTKTVILDDFVGDLKIEYANVSEIFFEGEKVLSGIAYDEDLLERTSISLKQTGNKMTLTWLKPKLITGTIAYHGKIVVPFETEELNVKVSLGRVTSSGGNNELSIDAALGDVRVENHSGPVKIDADLGAVRVKDIDPKENLRIIASLGDVVYEGRLAKRSEIKASLGSIRLTLPEDTLVDIDAQVNMGNLSCDFPLTNFAKKGLGSKVNGIMGDQSLGDPLGKLIIKADLGSVDIKKAVLR